MCPRPQKQASPTKYHFVHRVRSLVPRLFKSPRIEAVPLVTHRMRDAIDLPLVVDVALGLACYLDDLFKHFLRHPRQRSPRGQTTAGECSAWLGRSTSATIIFDSPLCVDGDETMTAGCGWSPPNQNAPRSIWLPLRLLELRSINPSVVCGDCCSRYRKNSRLVENAPTGRGLWT